jgi:hypothetical protein
MGKFREREKTGFCRPGFNGNGLIYAESGAEVTFGIIERSNYMPHEQGHMSAEMEQCIRNCVDCHRVCLETISHCLQIGGPHAAPDHIKLLQDCVQICQDCERLAKQDNDLHMQACADMCRKCAASCRAMAA